MVGTDIKANSHKVFPEMMWTTNGQDLLGGQSNLFKINGISPNQIITPISYAVDNDADVKVQFLTDNKAISEELPAEALGGIAITNDLSPHPAHEIGFAFKEFKMTANNSGATDTDHRARLKYLTDARTTARRIVQLINNLPEFNVVPDEDPTPIAEALRTANKDVLTKRDIQAIQILWQERKINVLERILNGSSVPPLWEDFLKIHEVISTYQNAIVKTLSTVYSGTELINYDVPDGKVATLEGVSMDVGAVTTVGEKTFAISRDDDKDFLTWDPACMGTSQKHYDFHIHAFDNLLLRIKDTQSTASYKAYAGLTIRRPGAAFKAKMEEFSPGVLPSDLEPSEAEERIIEKLRLRELARTGIVAIG